MTLPGSPLLTLILLIVALLCLGSWANAQKAAGQKWRFELFYYDFAIGAVIAAVIAALTFGSVGLDGFTVMDDLGLAGKRQDAFAFLAGCIFNLGNILIVAALSIAGLSVAFPVGMGVALIVAAIAGRILHPSAGSAALTYAGCAALVAAVVFDALAWRRHRAIKAAEALAAASALAAEQTAQGKAAPPGKKKSSRKRAAATAKALLLAVIGGLLVGVFPPLIGMAGEGENGLGPYTAGLIFTLGIAFSTFVYNLFFINLPLHGTAIEMREYFTGKTRNHLVGVAGGMVWCVGLFASFVAVRVEGPGAVQPYLSTAFLSAPPLLAAVWGVASWKEFGDAENSIKLLLGLMFLLFVAGIALLSISAGSAVH